MTVHKQTDPFSFDPMHKDILVNDVDTHGTSDTGIALAFKQKFPNEQEVYEDYCSWHRLKMGTVLITPILSSKKAGIYTCRICYFPTITKPNVPANIRNVYESLVSLRQYMFQFRVMTADMPALGCELEGLQFPELEKCVRFVFDKHKELQIRLYKPSEK